MSRSDTPQNHEIALKSLVLTAWLCVILMAIHFTLTDWASSARSCLTFIHSMIQGRKQRFFGAILALDLQCRQPKRCIADLHPTDVCLGSALAHQLHGLRLGPLLAKTQQGTVSLCV